MTLDFDIFGTSYRHSWLLRTRSLVYLHELKPQPPNCKRARTAGYEGGNHHTLPWSLVSRIPRYAFESPKAGKILIVQQWFDKVLSSLGPQTMHGYNAIMPAKLHAPLDFP
jgi:hypothetical protein